MAQSWLMEIITSLIDSMILHIVILLQKYVQKLSQQISKFYFQQNIFIHYILAKESRLSNNIYNFPKQGNCWCILNKLNKACMYVD